MAQLKHEVIRESFKIAFDLSIELPHFYSVKRRKVAVKHDLDVANRKDSRTYGVNAHWLKGRPFRRRRRRGRNVWHRRVFGCTDITICLFLHCIFAFGPDAQDYTKARRGSCCITACKSSIFCLIFVSEIS